VRRLLIGSVRRRTRRYASDCTRPPPASTDTSTPSEIRSGAVTGDTGGADRKRAEGAVEESIRAFVQGEDLERLRRMNEEFTQRENEGNKSYFEQRLAEHFSMLCANGTVIDGRGRELVQP
jgi:hypothetical protein